MPNVKGVDAPPRDERSPLWQMVGLADYARPERPAADAVRTGLRGLFKTKTSRSAEERPFVAEDDLRLLPPDALEAVARWPDWRDAVPALDRAFAALSGPEGGPIGTRVVVGAPYSGVRETVRCWAERHQWSVLEPPSPERIVSRDLSWFEPLDAEDGPPIVIAELEHCMVRHPLGLDCVRRLLDRLHATRRPCVITANSWAWAYLNAVIRIGDGLPPPVTFQAFGADRLDRWFRRLVSSDEPVNFRLADDGSLVLTPAPATSDGMSEDTKTPKTSMTFLRMLAGYSRGIAGVAWAVWRRSLEIAATDDVERRLADANAEFEGRVICVRSWARMAPRALPVTTALPELLLLHALLIHGGLSDEALPHVLPGLGSGWSGALRTLALHGIVEAHQGRWQVTPLGYPQTRDALAEEGLLVDSM